MMRLKPHATSKVVNQGLTPEYADTEKLTPLSLATMLGMGVGALFVSFQIAEFTHVPFVLILTTIALLLAQWPLVQRIPGAKLFGIFSVYLFLAVVGAFCELTALIEVGRHAFDIMLFTVTIVSVHGLFLVLLGLLLKSDWYIIAIASQANIGGASTAMALAQSFKRNDLLLPAILAGSLGSGLGTYLGFLVSGLL